MADAAGCATCHTLPGKVPYSGGYAIRTPFGSVVASNITPDPIAGIGRWRFDDFRRAMLLGLSPEGRHYYPAFPYLNYKDMQEGDLADLFAYLQSLPPSGQEVVENQLVAPFSFRPAMAVWKLLYLEPPGSVSERGAYLTEVLGHCDVCHTIRNFLGAPVDGQHLSGVGEEASINAGTPNVTPHEEGLLRWSEAALKRYLVSAVRPDGQVSGGQMAEVIRGVTSRLTTEDRAAMVAYLRNLPAQPTP
ncbi:c-type cytochrome [Marinobacterium aestuariivivens]|uniref:Cytochrome C n=1 Tax=Marinobacterium aestuariivivens TaxID=1698799 RepID=A0ABW2A5L8_9GAMM